MIRGFSLALVVVALSACSRGGPPPQGRLDALLRFAAVAQGAGCSQADCLRGAGRGQEWKWDHVSNEKTQSAPATGIACDRESVPFGGGKGTASAPFVICSAEQWSALSQAPGSNYRLVADIDFEGKAPVRLSRFTGSIMGDRHRLLNARWSATQPSALLDRNDGLIRDLVIEGFRIEGHPGSTPDRLALFVLRNRGTLRNVRGGEGNRIDLGSPAATRDPASANEDEDLLPVSAWRVGGLTSENSGMIEDCDWMIQVTIQPASEAVGGIVAWNRGTLRRVTARAWMNAMSGTGVGGVAGVNVGEVRQARLEFVPFEVQRGEMRTTPSRVVGLSSVGGIVGRNLGTIAQASVWASVQGEQDAGGVAGLNAKQDAHIEDVDFNGAVTGGSPLGGIVGRNAAGSVLSRCRSDAMVESVRTLTANEDLVVGGVAGINDSATIEGCRSQGVVSARGRGVAGGIVGRNEHPGGAYAAAGGRVERSVSSARVYAAGFVGGVAGENCAECKIWGSNSHGVADGAPELHCYSDRTGGQTAAGGIVGRNWGEVRGVYARITATDISPEAGGCGAAGRIIGAGDALRVQELVSRAPAGT